MSVQLRWRRPWKKRGRGRGEGEEEGAVEVRVREEMQKGCECFAARPIGLPQALGKKREGAEGNQGKERGEEGTA